MTCIARCYSLSCGVLAFPRRPRTLWTISHSCSESTTSSRSLRLFSASTSFHKATKQRRQPVLPPTPVRVRFAPSPTGYLHLGSLRTAIFNHLLARRTGGQFILRIEDTDSKRTVADAQARLIEDLKWAGLDWDEGPLVGGPHSPYTQSERTALYQSASQRLIDAGAAFNCYCSNEDRQLASDDEQSIGQKTGGCQSDCRTLNAEDIASKTTEGVPRVVRFDYKGNQPTWSDLVYGTIMPPKPAQHNSEQFVAIADTVLLKSDGTPTYHLANVVDDHEMRITHVIRGTEWMPSTALHVALYNAFSWSPPSFAHVGLLTDMNQNKLSKRNFDVDIRLFRDKYGLLPEALVNFLVLQGWANPDIDDVKSIPELEQCFDLKFSKGNSIVTLEKLWYLQQRHALRRIEAAKLDDSQEYLMTDMIQSLLLASKGFQDISPLMQATLGGRSIETFLRCIMIVDPGTYESPSQYIERVAYFFGTDHSTVGDTPRDPPLEHTVTGTDRDLEATARSIIRKTIDDADVKLALDLWHTNANCTTKELAQTIDIANHTCNKVLVENVEEALSRKSNSPDEMNPAPNKSGVTRRKLAAAVHGLLRRKLTSRDSPGPSSTRMMAVLGYEESRRRILHHDS